MTISHERTTDAQATDDEAADAKATRDGAPKATRSRDAAVSKEALLEAAQELFGKRGFEGTTIRDIGERAGVDAALIARYFGSKGDLYIATVMAEDPGGEGPSAYEGLGQMADAVVSRVDQRGPGPITQAIIRADTSEEIRASALQRMQRRLVDPLVAGMVDDQVDRPELRAEIAVAALLGISLARALNWFSEIGSAPKDDLVALIIEALQGAIAPDPDGRPGPTQL
jgi:AcrR family transcriptional regulator